MKTRSLHRPAGAARPLPPTPPAVAPVRAPRHRAALGLGAAALLIGAAAAGWRWHRPPVPAVAAAPSLLSPGQARLLEEAAREPKNAGPYEELAESYSDAGQPASALWAAAEAAARAPQNAGLAAKAAGLMTQMGYLQPAEAALRPIVSGGTAPAGPARRDLAELLLSTGRPAAALDLLREAGADAEVLRGRAREAMGDEDGAAAAYHRAGAAGDPGGEERLARLELARGHLPEAREAMRALARLRAVQPADLLLVAAIHAAAGTPAELDTALARVHRCLELQPGSAEAHYQAALLLRRQGHRTAAINELERVVALDPNHTGARDQLADLLQAMGQTARAHRERAFAEALKDQPDREFTEFSRARAAAAQPLDPAIALDQARMIASAASEAGQRATAISQAKAALKQHPDDPGLWLEIGLLYRQNRSRAPLEQLCRHWIARQPASGLPYWLLGDQALKETRVPDAIRYFEAACAAEPDRSDFCTALALAYLTNSTPENRARARPLLEKAIALNPRSPGPYQHLGLVLAQQGDLDAARCAYLRSLDLEPHQPDVLNKLVPVLERRDSAAAAGLFAGLARFEEEAARERERLTARVRQNPAQPQPRLELARFLVRHGDLAAARYQLERAAETGAAAPARRELAGLDRLLRAMGLTT